MKSYNRKQRLARVRRLLGFTDHVKVSHRDGKGNIVAYRLTWHDPAGQEAIIDSNGEILEFCDSLRTYRSEDARVHKLVIDDRIAHQIEMQETIKGYFRR